MDGGLYLNNESMISMYDDMDSYQSKFQDALYSQYQNTYKLSASNFFRGYAADAFKNYLKNGQINAITEFLDISSDMKMVIQLFAEVFFQFESTHDGKVSENVLDYIERSLQQKESRFNSMSNELNDAIAQASQYIDINSLQLDSVNQAYNASYTTISKIKQNLEEIDTELIKTANELLERIHNLKKFINQVKRHCYNNKEPNPDKMFSLADQNWYLTAGTVTLYMMLQEDPFVYAANEVTILEDQWAAGLCSDVYAYAGYSFMKGSYEAGIESGTAFVKAKGHILAMNGYAQFTDYLSAQGEIKVAYAEGEAKAGFSDKYVGFRVEAEAGLISAEGKLVIGSEDLNAFVKGEAKVLCADGKAAFEFEPESGEFAVGFDASADLASASVKGGFTLLGYKNKDSATGETDRLLGFGLKAKGGIDAGAALWAESKTAYETDWVNVNATTIKIKAEAFLGIDMELTFPTFVFKWGW